MAGWNIRRSNQIHNLKINRTGSGSGTVTSGVSSPARITCGEVCEYALPGAPVGLWAEPDAGSHFTGWGGGVCAGGGICSISMDADKLVTARFVLGDYWIYLPLAIR